MLFIASKDSDSWIVSLVCQDLSKATGGCNRSLQIYEIFIRNGWILKPINHSIYQSSVPLKTVFKAFTSISRDGPFLPFSVDSIRAQGRSNYMVRALLDDYPSVKGVVMEGTGYGVLSSLPEWKLAGKKIILVPHNIESLAANLDVWTHKNLSIAQRFQYEQKWLAIADAIFTISIEEAWWLELHGLRSSFLPYYPPVKRKSMLETVRKNRTPDNNIGWLYISDFNNPPNRLGAQLMLDWLKTVPNPPNSLTIAGRGCDWFSSRYASSLPNYCTFVGEISDEKLFSLYCRCTAQLIIHPPTSGMLTRVIDAALAGIPVVGNLMALKSYSFLFSYSNPPILPQYPASSVQQFLHAITSSNQ